MSLNVTFLDRYFQAQPPYPFNTRVEKLSWSIYGGPDQATFTAHCPYEHLFKFLSALRSPVIVSDCFSNSVWDGYINTIVITYQHLTFSVTLDALFNRVKVVYTYLSPDNKLSSPQNETAFIDDPFSQLEYGVKEKILYRQNVDDHFAENLASTFLQLSSAPKTILSPSDKLQPVTITFHAKGWFHTLDWIHYQNLEGYYANQGPGPGICVFGDGTTARIAQGFTPGIDCSVSEAYFLLRRVGEPNTNLYCRIHPNNAGVPNHSVNLGQSANVDGTAFPAANSYRWIKFTWSTPVPLTAGNLYWLTCYPNITNASKHYAARVDEMGNFNQEGLLGYHYTTSWKRLVPLTMEKGAPDFYFRVVTVKDSGALLAELSSVGNQFFSTITSTPSNVNSCPYRDNNLTVLEEIKTLMALGSADQRPFVASVDPQRRLNFSLAPHPHQPAVFLNRDGFFYTPTGERIPKAHPPIGQYAMLKGIDYFLPAFDIERMPTYFVDKYSSQAPF